MSTPLQFPLTGGLHRRNTPARAPRESFYTLSGMRQARAEFGSLELVPRFASLSQLTQGTYWNGSGSATEPTASAVRWVQETPVTTGYLAFTDYVLHDTSGAQLPVIEQITFPSGTATTKGCLLVVASTSVWTITLGNTYDVEIDGTNTFKWRVNSGAYTTAVVIDAVNGNLIDSNGVRLYWLASTGFTVGNVWSWRRVDRSSSSAFGLSGVPCVRIYSGVSSSVSKVFYVDYNAGSTGKVYVIEKSTTNGATYVRTVGYQYLQVTSIEIYEDHLFGFGSSSRVYNSDLTNFDNYISTDVNEADQYALRLVTAGATRGDQVLFGCVLAQRLFVFTTNAIYYADYAGLPAPFAFKFLVAATITQTKAPVFVQTPRGFYFAQPDGLWFFDGASLRRLDDTSIAVLLDIAGTFTISSLAYDSFNQEVIVLVGSNQGVLLVYQERYNTFYSVPVDFSASGCTGINVALTNVWFAGTINRTYLYEDKGRVSVPVYDKTDGTAFATPSVCTQCIGAAKLVQETQPLYVAANVHPAASTNYAVTTAVTITVSLYISNDARITGTPTTSASSVWTSASIDNKVEIPRLPFRYIAFLLEVIGTVTKPAHTCNIRAIETDYRVVDQVKR